MLFCYTRVGGKEMNITLTPELESFINEKIQSGLYNSPGEVLREGLRLLRERDELQRWRKEELRREVMKGVEQMRNGQYRTYNSAEELAEEVIREARAEFNSESASRTINELTEKFHLLANNPMLGRTEHDYIIGLRSFPYKNM